MFSHPQLSLCPTQCPSYGGLITGWKAFGGSTKGRPSALMWSTNMFAGKRFACAVWLEAARAVTTTGIVSVTLGSAVGNPVLGSHAKESCSIWNSSRPSTPCDQPCASKSSRSTITQHPRHHCTRAPRQPCLSFQSAFTRPRSRILP